MTLFKRRDLLPIAMLAATLLVTAYYYEALPETIAVHFGVQGEPNGWADKGAGLFLMPVMCALGYLLLRFLPSIATKQDYANLKALDKEIYWFAVLMVALLSFAQLSIIGCNLGLPFPFSIFNVLLAAVLFYSGLLTRKAKRNYFVGVRLPWTLADDRVWKKTNELAGSLLMAFSVAFLAVSLFDSEAAFAVLFAGIITVLVVSVGYSFMLSRR